MFNATNNSEEVGVGKRLNPKVDAITKIICLMLRHDISLMDIKRKIESIKVSPGGCK